MKNNRKQTYGFALLLFLSLACSQSQEPAPAKRIGAALVEAARPEPVLLMDADSARYPFIRMEENRIRDGQHLQAFYAALRALEAGETRQVRIVHIGDSHVQAGFFTGELRNRFQERFGDAGRGLIVPFGLAGSHNTLDLGTASSARWEGRLRTFQKNGPPVGLSGTSLRATADTFSLRLWLKGDQPAMHDRLRLFTHPVQGSRTWRLRTADGRTLEGEERRISFGSEIRFSLPAPQFSFHLESAFRRGTPETLLFGISLESSEAAGILYHAAGLNGATFYHFHRGEYFFSQLPELQPDLVIVSLGTNESLLQPFQKGALQGEVRRFMEKLKRALPDTPVLLTSQPDALRGKTEANPQGPVFRAILEEEAKAHNCAFWDLFSVMGGQGSVHKWRSAQLAHKDMVHYRQAGYQLMGELLFNAMIRDYGRAD